MLDPDSALNVVLKAEDGTTVATSNEITNGNTVKITPSTTLVDKTKYTATVTGATDLLGQTGTATVSFTTESLYSPLSSERYDIDVRNHQIKVWPYTYASTFIDGVTLDDGYSAEIVDETGVEIASTDEIGDGYKVNVINAAGVVEETFAITLVTDKIQDDFNTWRTDLASYSSGDRENGWAFQMPTIANDGLGTDAYIKGEEIADGNNAIHIYVNGNPSSTTLQQLGILWNNGMANGVGTRFIAKESFKINNSDTTVHSLLSAVKKDGTTLSLAKLFTISKDGIYFMGEKIADASVGTWYDVQAFCDSETGRAIVYVNGEVVYDAVNSVVCTISEVNAVRCAYVKFEDGKVNDAYIDNYAIYGVGSFTDDMFDAISVKLTSNTYTVDDKSICGFKGMSVADIKSGAIVSTGASVEVYNQDGTLADDSTPAIKGMKLVVSSANRTNSTAYTLTAQHYALSDEVILVNGLKNEEKFGIGTVSATIDVTNYLDEVAPLKVAIAQYSNDGRLLALNMDSESVARGNKTVSADLNIETASGTYVKALVWDENMQPLADANTMQAYDDDTLESVRFTYPEYTTKALTFSYDDLQDNDAELIKIFDKYGLKATFNLVTSKFSTKTADVQQQIKGVYDGYEIASHSYSHPRMYLTEEEDGVKPLTYDEVVTDIDKGQTDIANLFGEAPIGFVWPYRCPSTRDS